MENRDLEILRSLGNNETKLRGRAQETQRLFFVFTKFPNVEIREDLKTMEQEFRNSLSQICERFQYSHEICPHTKRLHFQGQMFLTKKMRRSQIVKYKHLNMFLDPQRGSTIDNNKYIQKNTDTYYSWIRERTDDENEFKKIRNELVNHSWNELIALKTLLWNKRPAHEREASHDPQSQIVTMEEHGELSLEDKISFIRAWCACEILDVRHKNNQNAVYNRLTSHLF